MKTAQLNIRTEKDIKEQAEQIFKEIGLTYSQAVNLFFKQVILNNGLPFELKLPKNRTPNKETLQAIEDVKNNIDVKTHKSAKNMFKDLGIEI